MLTITKLLNGNVVVKWKSIQLMMDAYGPDWTIHIANPDESVLKITAANEELTV